MKIAMRIALAALGLSLLILAVVRIVTSVKKNSTRVESSEQVLLIRSHKITRGQVVDEVKISGTIRPQNEVEIFPKLAGRVIALNFDVGDLVKAGDTLCVIEHREIAFQEQAALGSLAIARANEAVAHNDLERMKKLFEEKVISHTQLEQVQLKFDMTKAQAMVAKAQADLASQQRLNAIITSPIKGVITKRVVSLGTNVSPQAAVFTIQNIDQIKLVTSVDAKTQARLKKGMRTAIKFDQLPKSTFSGVIISLSPSLDIHSRRASVEVDIQGQVSSLVPNMFVNGFLILKKFDNVLVVPNKAINNAEEKSRVFRIVDGKIQVAAPILGQRDEVNSVILDGLSEGDDIAVSGFESLSDGKSVTIEDSAR